MKRISTLILVVVSCFVIPSGFADWFENLKLDASDESLYQLLYEMPKGGDLHQHMSGSGFSEWWYELALAAKDDGYVYYTKVKINNCRPYGEQAFGTTPYLLLFKTINASKWAALSDCEQGEYLPLEDLNAEQRAAWQNSIRLDKPFEGRDEFFQPGRRG